MRMLEQPQVHIEVHHSFSGGMCTRTVKVPKGVLLMGAIHLTDHVNVMYGDISIFSDGVERRLTGYNVVPSAAGVKRLGFTHEDTYWSTILRTDLTTAEEVESQLTAKDYDDPRVIAMNKLTEIGE